MQGYTITNAISKVGLYGTAFYKSLNDDQARQLQSAKNRYKKNNN